MQSFQLRAAEQKAPPKRHTLSLVNALGPFWLLPSYVQQLHVPDLVSIQIPALAARYEYSGVKTVTKHLAWLLSSHIRPPHTLTSVRERERFGHIFDIQL